METSEAQEAYYDKLCRYLCDIREADSPVPVSYVVIGWRNMRKLETGIRKSLILPIYAYKEWITQTTALSIVFVDRSTDDNPDATFVCALPFESRNSARAYFESGRQAGFEIPLSECIQDVTEVSRRVSTLVSTEPRDSQHYSLDAPVETEPEPMEVDTPAQRGVTTETSNEEACITASRTPFGVKHDMAVDIDLWVAAEAAHLRVCFLKMFHNISDAAEAYENGFISRIVGKGASENQRLRIEDMSFVTAQIVVCSHPRMCKSAASEWLQKAECGLAAVRAGKLSRPELIAFAETLADAGVEIDEMLCATLRGEGQPVACDCDELEKGYNIGNSVLSEEFTRRIIGDRSDCLSDAVFSEVMPHTFPCPLFLVPFETAAACLKGRKVLVCRGKALLNAPAFSRYVVPYFAQKEVKHVEDTLSNLAKDYRLGVRAETGAEELFHRINTYCALSVVEELQTIVPPTQARAYPSFVPASALFRSVHSALATNALPPCVVSHFMTGTSRHHRHMERLNGGKAILSTGFNAGQLETFWKPLFTADSSSRRQWDTEYNKIPALLESKLNAPKGGCLNCKALAHVEQKDTSLCGCPFARGAKDIEDLMSFDNISADARGAILAAGASKNVGKACSLYFNAKHTVQISEADVFEPKSYYVEATRTENSSIEEKDSPKLRAIKRFYRT